MVTSPGLKVRETFPYSVQVIENCWIPLPDGVRLAARMWLAEGAEQEPVPAVVEAIPYRKRDFMRARDEPIHHYFAGHGYASIRIDLRGSGDSQGVLVDEYSAQEHQDILQAFRWIAAQPWCDGNIGMMGISWGGFNALQVAALDPPELKAIITLCSSDDRYADDAHYMGGCLLNENLTWGSVLTLFNACPPDPEIVGSEWRQMWMERLEGSRLFPAVWMAHPHRDDYWKHASVCQDYSRIRCPVYAIGGWADAYSNTVPRLLESLQAPCKGLVGPWAHHFPHDAIPGPEIGFLQEATRWWDHWLKGRDSGLMDEPTYRVWMQQSVPPAPFYPQRPGRWVAEQCWPSQRIVRRRLYLSGRRRLSEEPGPARSIPLHSPQTVGMLGGEWCAFGTDGEMPQDQRAEDGRSAFFDSARLEEALEILGAPLVEVELESDCPNALLAVRLNDVAPDGASTRVTYGLLNLAHRDSHEHPRPLQPGRRCRVRIRLNDIAHAFPAGHVIRAAFSTSYWPMAWPSPQPVTLRLIAGSSHLELPIRPPSERDAFLREFEKAEHGPVQKHVHLHPSKFERKIERDLTSNQTVYTLYDEGPEFNGASLVHMEEIQLDLAYQVVRRYRIDDHDPLTAQAEVMQNALFRRPGWEIRIDLRTKLSCSQDAFRVQAVLRCFEGEKEAFTRRWDESIPRQLV